ncbi:MAG: hypothetical protein PHC40_07445 [Eubacteriales bacterium]|nr:hypothetical protein [Eubacteriales bacterium]
MDEKESNLFIPKLNLTQTATRNQQKNIENKAKNQKNIKESVVKNDKKIYNNAYRSTKFLIIATKTSKCLPLTLPERILTIATSSRRIARDTKR